MTKRERLIALMQGREHDRVPFIQYESMAPKEEVWALVGRENVGLLRWTNVHRFEAVYCSFEQEEIMLNGRKGVRRILRTPEGDLVDERLIGREGFRYRYPRTSHRACGGRVTLRP